MEYVSADHRVDTDVVGDEEGPTLG